MVQTEVRCHLPPLAERPALLGCSLKASWFASTLPAASCEKSHPTKNSTDRTGDLLSLCHYFQITIWNYFQIIPSREEKFSKGKVQSHARILGSFAFHWNHII